MAAEVMYVGMIGIAAIYGLANPAALEGLTRPRLHRLGIAPGVAEAAITILYLILLLGMGMRDEMPRSVWWVESIPEIPTEAGRRMRGCGGCQHRLMWHRLPTRSGARPVLSLP